MGKSFAQRFWAKVNRTEGCWEWTACKTRNGYGQMGRSKEVFSREAHRISYEINIGPIPAGMCVCHTCDNPSCVRPDHLFLGTIKDNVVDMWRKGRASPPPISHGENNPMHVLTEKQVAEIKEALSKPYRGIQTYLADKYSVSRKSIYNIRQQKTWR